MMTSQVWMSLVRFDKFSLRVAEAVGLAPVGSGQPAKPLAFSR
jgi:hypothetical protein